MPADPVAEFTNVSKTYTVGLLRRRLVRAVREVSLRIEPGEVFGLLGPNRAGKTTLVKILLSLCAPSSGQVLRLGKPLRQRRTLARVGYMHENHSFPSYLTASGLLQYYAELTLLPSEGIGRRVTGLLERVGLADRCREPIAGFSKGMVQRLGLAQALINEPELLVLDEPTEGLDMPGRQLLRQVIDDQRRRGGSVLLVSHVLTEVEQLCDRVAVLVEGRRRYCGALADLLRDPAGGQPRPLELALEPLYTAQSP